MIPSLDAYLINKLKLRQDIVRLPVTEMGCAAGISGIIYAKNFLQSNPGKRAAVIAVESPTATFQLNDFDVQYCKCGYLWRLPVFYFLLTKTMKVPKFLRKKCIIL
jgi:hypothetical protein